MSVVTLRLDTGPGCPETDWYRITLGHTDNTAWPVTQFYVPGIECLTQVSAEQRRLSRYFAPIYDLATHVVVNIITSHSNTAPQHQQYHSYHSTLPP